MLTVFNKSRSPFFQHYAHFFRSALSFFPFVSESLNTGYEGIVYTFTVLVVAAVLVLLGYDGEGENLICSDTSDRSEWKRKLCFV